MPETILGAPVNVMKLAGRVALAEIVGGAVEGAVAPLLAEANRLQAFRDELDAELCEATKQLPHTVDEETWRISTCTERILLSVQWMKEIRDSSNPQMLADALELVDVKAKIHDLCEWIHKQHNGTLRKFINGPYDITHLQLLAWAIAGLRTKPSPSAPPAAEVGGGQPSPMVGRAMKIFHNTHSANFLKRLRVDRGAIVSSADCSTMEVAFAQKERRWYVDEDGMGYVMRMKPWREECERLIEARCNARDVSDSPSAPPAAEVGGEPNYPIPEPGTLASELGRIADYIESNDCTRSWASKFIYSIIDELPTAIANHVMRPASPSVPPVTDKGTGEQGRDEKAMDIAKAKAFLIRVGNTRGSCVISSNDCSTLEIATAQACGRFYVDPDTAYGYVLREAQPTHKAPTHQ